MKIINKKSKNNYCELQDICIGDLFEYEGNIYIASVSFFAKYPLDKVLVCNIKNGICELLPPATRVKKLESEVIVYD